MDESIFDKVLQTTTLVINATTKQYTSEVQRIAIEIQQRFINPFCRKHKIKFATSGCWFMFFKGKNTVDSHSTYPMEVTGKAWSNPPLDYAQIYKLLATKCYKGCLFEYMENYDGEE